MLVVHWSRGQVGDVVGRNGVNGAAGREWRRENQIEGELYAAVASGNSEGVMISSLAMVLAA
jgi:hypothetical protein